MFWRRAGHFGVLTHPHNPHNQSRYRDDDPRFATVCVISCSLVPRSLVGCGAIMSSRLVQTGSPRLADTPSLHLVYVGPTPHYTRPALPSDSAANDASESTGLRAGEIIAIIAGVGVVLLVLVVVAVFIACKKKDAPTFHSTEMGSTKK